MSFDINGEAMSRANHNLGCSMANLAKQEYVTKRSRARTSTLNCDKTKKPKLPRPLAIPGETSRRLVLPPLHPDPYPLCQKHP